MDGIIVLNKPEGFTSMDCCAVIRGICKTKKVGHTGTLDPNATGVLPVCVGKATRLIEYMDFGPKKYRAGCRLGIVTDTQDVWGKLTDAYVSEGQAGCFCSESLCVPVFPAEEDVRTVLMSFIGEQKQIPPAYSAIKINGKKLYEYARAGKNVEVRPRDIVIYGIELLDYDQVKGELIFDVTCSRGTYVRTICHDLGQKLGLGGAMSSLVRLETCGYSLDDAVSLDELREKGAEVFIKPVESVSLPMPRLDINDRQMILFSNGVPGFVKGGLYAPETVFSVYFGEMLAGTAKVLENGDFKPLKVFK